jgi:hypothetical protein
VESCIYRIVVEGELGSRFEAAFNGMRLEARSGMTEIIGPIKDQAELQGVLDAVASLGLSLVSAAPLSESPSTPPVAERR